MGEKLSENWMAKDIDVLILGATGFTGKYVAKAFHELVQSKDARVQGLRWGVETLSWAGIASSQVEVVVVDVGDAAALSVAVARAVVVVNCVGPFRFSGVDVVAACIAANTSYVDIAGEPEFVERILTLSQKAKDAKVTVVPCCGFDSIPADLGNLFVKDQFRKRGYTAATCEVYIDIEEGPSGTSGNFATYESAVYSLANAHILRKMRKEANRPPLPLLGRKLPLYGSARFEKLFTKKWCVPFFGADASIVRLSQQLQLASSTSSLPPTQFNAYFSLKSFAQVLRFSFFGFSMFYLSSSSFGRNLLLKYPGFFSMGLFKKTPPTPKQIAETTFTETFMAKGFKRAVTAAEVDAKAVPDYEIIAQVHGPEGGYVTTPIAVICSALQILKNRNTGLIPHGVLTPAAAFGNTDLIRDLENSGITFSVHSERDLVKG
ncbi:hypothetical protein HDU99_004624 [Rhizoclosmatium hyalinum]|nr:hypothetical protein HDU99_004624 [Rhizoclosmatium hyalinum]